MYLFHFKLDFLKKKPFAFLNDFDLQQYYWYRQLYI